MWKYAVRCETRAACCIEWVTMTMAIGLLQLIDQVLDARGGDRVERRARLVHEDDFRLDGDRARDAQALLLAARQAGAGLCQAILDFVPQARRAAGWCTRVSSRSARPRARPCMRGP